ncbi:MAG: DUF1566 domain-containing protein [Leptospiraceae bacterium]|nr:DUF1566 domain-containing protein [Leptospiraceae bacterium]
MKQKLLEHKNREAIDFFSMRIKEKIHQNLIQLKFGFLINSILSLQVLFYNENEWNKRKNLIGKNIQSEGIEIKVRELIAKAERKFKMLNNILLISILYFCISCLPQAYYGNQALQKEKENNRMVFGILALMGSLSSYSNEYSIGGTISGLNVDGLVLQNNGSDDLSVSSTDTIFSFATKMRMNSTYDVTVKTQPDFQNCSIENNNGIVGGDITDVKIICILYNTFTEGNILSLLKTGQATSYLSGDDGTHQKSLDRSYTDNNDGTIIDNNTKLIWQKCSYGQNNDSSCTGNASKLNLNDSMNYCKELNLIGRKWELPNVYELFTIVNFGKSNPSIDTTFFPNIPNNFSEINYFTKNYIDFGDNNISSWIINFYYGNIGSSMNGENYVRCVSK